MRLKTHLNNPKEHDKKQDSPAPAFDSFYP